MKYILYARKSSEDKSKQILSLESQVSEMKKLASSLDLEIDKIYTESKSAKLPNNRPLFLEMLKLLENNHEAEGYGILCWKIDRLSRNPIDSGKIQWLLQQSKIKVIQTSDKQYLPSDNVLLLNIEGSMANQYILDLSKNVKRGLRTKLEKGGWPCIAPIGYLNDGKGGILVDKERSPYVKQIFQMYISGNYTIKEIADKIYLAGLKSRGGNKYHKSQIYTLLNNKFYYGIMISHGEEYPGRHKPIISKRLFDEAQEMAHKKQHVKKNRLDFIFRGLMVCARCGCLYTASKKRGKHIYYYCTNGKNKCEEHKSYLKEDEAIKMLANVFERLTFPEEVINLMYEASLDKLKQESENNEYLKIKNELLRQLKIREDRQAELFNLLLDKTISKEGFETKRKTIADELNSLNEELKTLENKNQPLVKTTLEQIKNLFLTQSVMKNKFLEANPNKQREIIKNILWNAEVKDGKLTNIKFKEPYSLFAKDPQNGSLDLMWAGLDSNQRRREPTDLQSVPFDRFGTDPF